jgi:hypothetical protein
LVAVAGVWEVSSVVARTPFRVISLCAGGGGLDLGIRLAIPDARTVCYVEREITAAGCFHGTLDAFIEAVRKHHGDNEYGQEYEVVITAVRELARLRGGWS